MKILKKDKNKCWACNGKGVVTRRDLFPIGRHVEICEACYKSEVKSYENKR